MMPVRMLTAAVVLFAAGCAPTLAGQLKGPGGIIVANKDARVNISSLATENPSPPMVVEVDDGGNFSSSEKLEPGPYLVEALVPGFAPESRRVMVGEAYALEIEMKRVPRVHASTVGANVGAEPGRGAGGATLTPPNL